MHLFDSVLAYKYSSLSLSIFEFEFVILLVKSHTFGCVQKLKHDLINIQEKMFYYLMYFAYKSSLFAIVQLFLFGLINFSLKLRSKTFQ